MFIIIMLYAILLSINFHRQNIEYASMLEICSDIFFSIFFIEILIKVYVYKLYFFNKYFNIFELILIIILIVSRVLYILNGDVYDEISEIRIVMKILQVFRCLRLVYCFKML